MADVVEAADVWVFEGGRRPRLGLEPRGELLFRDLQRDSAIEARVAGPVHLAHAAGAEVRRDFVGPEPCARGQRHRADILRAKLHLPS